MLKDNFNKFYLLVLHFQLSDLVIAEDDSLIHTF